MTSFDWHTWIRYRLVRKGELGTVAFSVPVVL